MRQRRVRKMSAEPLMISPIANQIGLVVSRMRQTSRRLLFQRKSARKTTGRTRMSVVRRMWVTCGELYHVGVHSALGTRHPALNERLHASDLLQARHRNR